MQSVQAEDDNPPLVVAESNIAFFFHEASCFSCDGFIVMESVGKDECADKKARNLDFTQDSLLLVLYATSVSVFSITSLCGCGFRHVLLFGFRSRCSLHPKGIERSRQDLCAKLFAGSG